MSSEFKVADHLGAEQAAQVRPGRTAEPWVNLLRRGGTTQSGASLEHRDAEAGAGQVGGGH
jgi:hypothetical protein